MKNVKCKVQNLVVLGLILGGLAFGENTADKMSELRLKLSGTPTDSSLPNTISVNTVPNIPVNPVVKKQEGPITVIGEEIVVTASRSESKRKDCGVVVDVITSKDIERTNAKNLTDVLKKCSPIDVVEYPGLLSVVNMRGFAPELFTNIKHHALLIDGRRAGAVNLSTIPLDNVERIEVLKGPASSLYGAEAMAGVINVITKKSSGKIKTSGYAEGGEFESKKFNLQSGGAVNRWLDFDISITDEKGGDYEVPEYKIGNWEWKGGVWKGNNYSNRAMSGRLGLSIEERKLNIRAEEFKSKVNYASDIYGIYGPEKKDLKRDLLEFSYEGKTRDLNWLVKVFQAKDKVLYYSNKDWSVWPPDVPWYKSSLNHSDYKGLQIQNTIKFGLGEFIIGTDYNFDKDIIESYKPDGSRKSPYKPGSEKTNWAGFLENKLSLGNLITTIGGRYDHYRLKTIETPHFTNYSLGSEDLSNFNPRGSLLYKFSDNASIHSSIGSAFVIPNPLQKAGSYTYWGKVYKGNPNLKPEKSLTYDIGFRFVRFPFNFDITYFYTDLKDKIDRKQLSATEFTYENVEKARMEGVESDLSFDIGKSLRLYSKLTHLIKARNITQNKDIYNVAKRKVNYGIDYKDERLSGRLNFRYVGKMKDKNWFTSIYGPSAEVEYGNFTICDLNISYKITKNFAVDLRINNLFNKVYEEKPGYPMPARTAYGGFKLDL